MMAAITCAEARGAVLQAELAVRRLAAALLAGGQALLFFEVLGVAPLGLVDVAAGHAGTELTVPVVLNDHQATAARALLWRSALQHYPPSFWFARIRHPAGRADPA